MTCLEPTRRPPSVPVCALAIGLLASLAAAGDVAFAQPRFLPGDTTTVLAAGHQQEMEIASSDTASLAVWSDCRSSPDNPTNPEGSGYDVYGAILDAAGNVGTSFVIDDGPGDQTLPHVAWNGESWLVAWMEPKPSGLPIYERIRGVRVAPDGTVLDPEPILIHQETWGCYCDFFGMAMAGGGPDGWVVVLHPNVEGLRAIRVQADGTVVNPTGVLVDPEMSALAYDIAFAQDEYMIVSSDGVQAKARRYSPTLQLLGTTNIPFAREVTTDGTNFLVTGQWDYSWPPKIEAMLLGHDGSILVDRFTVIQGTSQWSPSGEGCGFDGTNYWVTWGGISAARVSPAGVMLDPVGGFNLPLDWQEVSWPAYDTAPGGGLQYLWHDGLGGAGYPRDIHTARVTPDALLVNQTPASVSAPAQVEPDFAEGPGVNMVVFRSRGSDAARILVQRIDDHGAALDPEPIEVASGPVQWLETPTLDAPQVAFNGSVFMVTWSDTINVFARRMNPDGSFVDASPIVVMTGQHSAVGALGPDFLVSGSTVGTLLATGALRVARVDGVTGAVLDDPPITLSAPSLAGQYPHIETLVGRWLVVWESVYRDPWSTTVIESTAFAFVEADGSTTGQQGADLGERPGVAVSDDRALLIGIDTTVSGGYTDLEARILMADGTFLGPTFLLSTAPDDQIWPAATWDGTQFVAAWEDKRKAVVYFDERTDIYGSRVTADGVVLDPGGIPLTVRPQVEIRPTFMTTAGGTTLMAASTLRTDEPSLSAFRVGIHEMAGEYCQADLGFAGPGDAVLSVCGQPLVSEGTADLVLAGAAPHSVAWLVASLSFDPQPFMGGVLVPLPILLAAPMFTDASGGCAITGFSGGGGPVDFYVQFAVEDASQPFGFAMSNAVTVELLP